MEKAAKQDGSYYTALTEKYPAPRKGMKVIYGSDGELSNIEDSWHNDIPCVIRSKYTSSKKAIVEAAAKKTLIAKWGKNNRNKLYKKGGNIIGYGRATTFADKIGQKDHTLKKGDVATKLAYDNCKFGLSVDVKARKYKSKTKETHTMYKRDAGGMPDAIVDIWKTGVEKWGYKYSSSLSIPGETKITHENKK